jgi:signal transduction histidine kinase
MNKNFQSVLALIEGSLHLTEEEKKSIVKSIIEADNVLEITAFKLDKIEKVKRTMAIVLEETIEELEQKRKVVEEQNKELEIEAATERVRMQSMAMQHPGDFEKVNKELLHQLTQLKIDGLSGVSFYFVDEDEIVTVWDLSSPGSMSDPNSYSFKYDSKKYPALGGFVEILKTTQDDYFILDFPKQSLLQGIEELKEINPTIGEALKNAVESGALSHQWNPVARITNGILSIDLMKPPGEDTKTILLKMAGAFNQAYTRFLDLQKAEAQAREAQIEGALERVRSRTMAMQRSKDLAGIASLLFKQVIGLGVNAFAITFQFWLEDGISTTCWTSVGIGDEMQPSFRIPHTEEPFHHQIYKAWKKGEDFFVMETEGEELEDVYRYVAMQMDDEVLNIMGNSGFSIPKFQVVHCVFFLQGYIMFMTYERTPEAHDIFKRFGKVFEQSYTRFLDLQKAEAQTREAQIELAVERVRARTMSMQHSNELADTSFLLDSQIRALDIKTRGCAFNIYGDHESTEWFSSEAGTMPTYKTPREHVFLRYYKAGLTGKKIHIEEFSGQACAAHYNYLCTLPVMGDALKEMIKNGGSFPERQIDHVVYFKYGYLLFITLEPVPESHDIFIRFAKVFEQTYTRFLDLHKAEAQAEQARLDLIQIQTEKRRAEDALSELRITQTQLIQKEKLASLGELTAGIAHEIQNPLNFVNNFSELSVDIAKDLNDEIHKPDIDTEYIEELLTDLMSNQEKINHHGKRASSIVKGMLEHSRASTGVKELTDINQLADEYLRLSYHGLRAKDKGFNADFSTYFDENLPKIEVIPQDIGRVLLNLINNAFWAVSQRTAETGHVETGHALSLQPQYQPTVTVSTKQTNNQIIIKIQDNGTGMSEATKAKIFQPFFTTKPTGQGTGLGLSLAYDIVTKGHGGTLEVETKEGEGSIFQLLLPI